MDPLDRLRSLPRAGLCPTPTPLQRADRFGDAIGAEVWIKRDDVGSVGLAGNKVRKYDLVLGEARLAGADVLVTTGAAQSNSARAGAAATATLGLDCVLVLSGDAPPAPQANLLLDELFGARIVHAGDVGWRRLDELVEEVAAALAADGRHPVTAPVGCSTPRGALGFALAGLELHEQCLALGLTPAAVVHASSSGGTAAGLALANELLGLPWEVVAVDVGRLSADPRAHAVALAARAAAELDTAAPSGAGFTLDEDQIGPGYGQATAAATEAIDLLARTEGILCDPVYSGKGLAGLVARARAGAFDAPVVFWHTGGWHAFFDPHHAAAHASMRAVTDAGDPRPGH